MIKHLTRKELDVKKYDNCISNAINSRIYAYSWYLDIVCEDWDVLVKDDYQAVMPLPKRRKYFINYIYLPPWIQQLGIFHEGKVHEGLVEKFIKLIPKKFKLVDVFLNSQNSLEGENIIVRTNYILKLNNDFDETYKNFKKGRKSSIKQAQNFDLKIIENFNYREIIQLFKINKGTELNKSSSDYTILSELIEYMLPLNLVESIAIVNKKNELIGGAFFLKDTQRITYLFSSINKEGREKQAMSFLITYVIEKYSKTKFILDFEGSMISNIAAFFKSFGAKKEIYFNYKKRRLF